MTASRNVPFIEGAFRGENANYLDYKRCVAFRNRRSGDHRQLLFVYHCCHECFHDDYGARGYVRRIFGYVCAVSTSVVGVVFGRLIGARDRNESAKRD